MIFNSNTTSLGASYIPMAEGYDCSCGAALALVESARNDYAMFRAMLDIDAREIQIQRESTGYVMESELTSLAEAAGSGIFAKIKELFKKLAEKIKAIFHTFMSKINSLYKSDKQMVKTYGAELNRKTHIGNLEVKWVKYDPNYKTKGISARKFYSLSDGAFWSEDAEERHNNYTQDGVSYDSFDEDMDNIYADGGESNVIELKEIGGIRPICTYLDNYEKDLRTLNKTMKDKIDEANRIVKNMDKEANNRVKEVKDGTTPSYMNTEEQKDKHIEYGNRTYDMAVAYQDVTIKATQWVLATNKNEYKQNKAAFMKAIAANDKKLESTSIYLDAVAEAAEQEVDDVISSALSNEELSKLNKASLNVIDSDVSDDPDELTYGPNKYTTDCYGCKAGSIDTNINSKSESAFFGKLLY